jgi:putative spermidine/putrescine transport system permease protein
MRRRIDLPTLAFTGIMMVLAALTLLLLIAPTLVVLIVSFTDGFSLKFPPPGYSIRWYQELLDASQLHFAASNSLKIALATTLLSVLLGVAGVRLQPLRRCSTPSSCRPWFFRRWPSGSRR